MKYLGLFILTVANLACVDIGHTSSLWSSLSGDGPAPRRPLACAPSDGPFDCVRANCLAAQDAAFDEKEKRCECPVGTILSTVNAYECVSVDATDSSVSLQSADPRRQYLFTIEAPDADSLKKLLKNDAVSLAFVPHWNFMQKAFRVYANSKDMAQQGFNEKSAHDSMSPIGTLLFQPELDLYTDANAGVSGAVIGMPFWQLAVLPTGNSPHTGDAALDAQIASALAAVQLGVKTENVASLSADGCAGQCTASRILSDSDTYTIRRVRFYFKGGVVQDQISIFDKKRLQTAATLFLLNGEVSHYILQENDGAWLHGPEDDARNSRIVKLQSSPSTADVPKFRLNDNEAPVLIFETGKNDKIDSVIPRGPWTASHLYGWFRPEDGLPFFKNHQDTATLFGEEEIEIGMTVGHGVAVASLASDGYQHPLIPFAASDLQAGIVEKFIRNYRQAKPERALVASLSEIFAMSASACKANPIGHAIQNSPDILWIVGAGNSGHELPANSANCPQSIDAANVIRVAATAGESDLAGPSTYGERSVDIAELGCAPGLTICNAADAGTSLAAPRAARKISDLMNKYPTATPKQIRLAVLATARVLWLSYPLAVRSGGVVDAEAADRLLAQLPTWPQGQDLTSNDWQKLLVAAKSAQYPDSSPNRIRSYVSRQTQHLLQNAKDLQ